MKLFKELMEKLSKPVGELASTKPEQPGLQTQEKIADSDAESNKDAQILDAQLQAQTIKGDSIQTKTNGNGRSGCWRNKLPEKINVELNQVVSETHPFRNAYKRSMRVRDAQQWVAIAQLSQRIKVLEDELRRVKS